MKKILSSLLVLGLLTTVFFVGCKKDSTENVQEDAMEDETLEIGMCFDSFVIERWQKDRDVFVSKAQSLGAEVNVQNANGDLQKQKEQINYFIEKNVDCLVIVPVDGYELADEVAKAKDAGIKVVAYDRLISDANVDLYVSFDNDAVGKMLGDAIVDSGAQSTVMICGPLTDSNVPTVINSFESVMNKNKIDILDKYHVEGWRGELASAYVYENMNTIKKADSIMCGNDEIATAVIRALAVSRLAGLKVIVGQDADLPACQHIVEGTQAMTVYKPVASLAEQAAKLTVRLADGKELNVQQKISDGTYDVPNLTIEPVEVDAGNIDEIIVDGGFHSYEDVYLNINEDAE